METKNLFQNTNKKYLIFFLYSIIIGTLIFFIWKNFAITNDVKQIQKIQESFKTEEITVEQKNIDTDNDGLFDWQEVLYGTDRELADTDGDGVSDGQEVQQGHNPIIFGEGKESLEKITRIRKNIEESEKQVKFFSDAVQKQLALKEKMEYLTSLQNKNSSQEKQLVQENTRKKEIREKVNDAATTINNYFYKLEDENIIFSNAFLFFFPNNQKNIQSADVDEYVKENMPVYRALTQRELDNLKRLGESYIQIGEELKKTNMRDYDIGAFIDNLASSYLTWGQSIVEMHGLIKKGNRNIGGEEVIAKYTAAISQQLRNRKFISEFLALNEMSFSYTEPGKIFVYSL